MAASICHSQQDLRPATLVLLNPSGLGTMTFPDGFLSRNLRDTENNGIPLYHPPHVAPGSLTHKWSCQIVCAALGLSLSLAAVTQIDGFSQLSPPCSLLTICVSAHPHMSVSHQTGWIAVYLLICKISCLWAPISHPPSSAPPVAVCSPAPLLLKSVDFSPPLETFPVPVHLGL